MSDVIKCSKELEHFDFTMESGCWSKQTQGFSNIRPSPQTVFTAGFQQKILSSYLIGEINILQPLDFQWNDATYDLVGLLVTKLRALYQYGMFIGNMFLNCVIHGNLIFVQWIVFEFFLDGTEIKWIQGIW